MLLHEIAGFALALISMILYGVYMIPRKKSALSPAAYTFWMGAGILAAAIILGATEPMGGVSRVQLAIMIVSGIVWATGTHTYCVGVQLIGLSRSTPIKNLAAMFGTLFGILLLHEFVPNDYVPLALAIAGSAAVVISAIVLGGVEANGDSARAKKHPRAMSIGVICSLWAAIAYSIYTIPMKMLYKQGVTPAQFLFYMSIGCFIGMALTAAATKTRAKSILTRRDIGLAMLSGAMWSAGSLCANVAVKYIGVAITWPLTKTTLVAVLCGVWLLKEIDPIKHRKTLALGIALSIIGVALLAGATSAK